MTYIYDVTLNFNETLYDFFEWNNSDTLTHVRKIPIFKVSNEVFIDILSNVIKVSDTILSKIKGKTDVYGKKNKSFTACLIRNEDNIIALKFNDEGISKNISNIVVEEELDILEIKVNTTKIFEYEIIKQRKTLLTTRYDSMNKTYIEKQLNSLNVDNDSEKIKYLYFEYFGKYITDEKLALNKLKKEFVKNSSSNNLKEFFKLSRNKY